jgi:hypothetical protein
MISRAVKLAILVCLISLGYNLGRGWSQSSTPTESELLASDLLAGITLPSPELSPRDVVALQVAALADCQEDPKALRQCFLHASPANREVTGPLPHFAEMLRSSTFLPLITSQQAIVGAATTQGEQAQVLVTLRDDAGEIRLYRFYLSRQTAPPYTDCWMTDGVAEVGDADPDLPFDPNTA